MGNGEVGYLVLPNLTANQREATITVGSQVHRVVQSGVPTGNTDFEGSVTGLSGNCPALAFTVLGVPVRTNNSTDFRGGNCAAIRNGARVKVDGMFQADGTLLARRVELDDDDDDNNGH